MHYNTQYWIAMPSAMPIHKTIFVQTFLSLLALEIAKYCTTTTKKVQGIN
jgi:hypothetical protein